MVTALKGPFISAAGYTNGRYMRQAKKVKWLGVHTAEGATDEMSLGNFFDNNAGGSSHGGIGQDGGFAQYVSHWDTAWTNPPLNEESDTIELCGFAKWTRAEWLRRPEMLETFAHWLAWRSEVRDIPLTLLSVDELEGGKPGIVMHRTVNGVYHMSSHWDPGYNLPWDIVLPHARQIRNGGKTNPPPPKKPAWRGEMGWRRLAIGMEGSDVKELQVYLNKFGYGLEEDKKFGKLTENAVIDWQGHYGLERDGIVGPDSQKKMDSTKGPQKKPKPQTDKAPNEDRTEALQEAVHVLVDGWWGEDTDKGLHAVRMASRYHGGEFPYGVVFAQKRVGTKPDGVWGDNSTRAHDETVSDIQAALGVKKDGIWGEKTDRAFVLAWRKDALVNR